MREQLGKCAIYFNPLKIDEIVDAIKIVLNNDPLVKKVRDNILERNLIDQNLKHKNELEHIIKTGH